MARLNPFRRDSSGWVPASREDDPNPYWQVTFVYGSDVTGIVARKCEENVGEKIGWLARFDIAWAPPGEEPPIRSFSNRLYDFVLDYGNSSLARVLFDPPVINNTKGIRIYPTEWGGNYDCLKFDLIGCEYSECNEIIRETKDDGPISYFSCAACDTNTVGAWQLHTYAPDGSSGIYVESQIKTWFQADFEGYVIISRLLVQGGTEKNISFVSASDLESLVDTFEVYYQSELGPESQFQWRILQDDEGQPLALSGLADPFAVTEYSFLRPFLATRFFFWLNNTGSESVARFRFRVVGCKLTDPEQVCSINDIVYKGYCVGVIPSEEDNACHNIFLPGGYPLAIKSEQVQNFILSNREFVAASASQLVIGLTSENGVHRWSDGTPALYDNFVEEEVEVNAIQNTQCAFINLFNCFQWELFDCVPVKRSTVCQADLNECLVDSHGCSHTCANHQGSYHCECPEGYVLDGLYDCVDVCKNENTNNTWFTDGGDRCVYVSDTEATWEDAVADCSDRYARLPTINEFNALRTLLNQSDGVQWLGSFDNVIAVSLTQCPSTDTSSEPATIWHRECGDTLPYICLRDITITKLQNLIGDGTPMITLNMSYGFIELHAYGPWYFTSSQFSINIAVGEGLKVRLNILNVNLRRRLGSATEASNCTDVFIVRDSENTFREICGTLSGIDLILSNPVSLEVVMGELEPEMPNEIGFNVLYDAVDCTKVRCRTGCGLTELKYENAFLETSPFPADINPFSECQTSIAAPDNQYIAIQFVDYKIKATNQGQCEDSVAFFYADWEVIMGCESSTPPILVTNSSRLNVRLTVGLEAVSEGIQANVTFFDKPGCPESTLETCAASSYTCGGSSGIITSPNYPGSNTIPVECIWLVNTPESSYIRLRFIEITFPDLSTPCEETSVQIYEESFDTQLILGQYCANGRPPSDIIESSLNSVTIELIASEPGRGVVMMIDYEAAYFDRPSTNDTDGEVYQCPTSSDQEHDWIYYHRSCYQFVRNNEKLTWFAAEDECQGRASGGHLVSIRNKAEANFIHYMLTSNWSVGTDGIYIGLGDRDNKGIFRWTDSAPMTYTDWHIPHIQLDGTRAVNEPDGSTLDACVHIQLTSIRSTALWHDIPCLAEESYEFICKVAATSDGQGVEARVRYQAHDVVSECPPTMLACESGECVHRVYACDGQADCADASDEEGCPDIHPSLCATTDFQCDDGACIPMSFYCDNVTHCIDRSDERHCAPYNCSKDEFRCQNGRCIPSEFTCDLVDHCFDGSDEIDCLSQYGEDVFTCYNGDEHPQSAKCDGIVDCIGSSAEDELLDECAYRKPNNSACGDDEIRCNNGKCVDGSVECMYEIDKKGYISGCRDVSHLRNCEEFQCPTYSFKCPDSYCIPLRFRCNGRWDCTSGDDENDCASYVCPAGTYQCRGRSECLTPNEICDGYKHCLEADDEHFCGVACPTGCNCSGISFVCDSPGWTGIDGIVFSPTTKKIVVNSASVYLTENVTVGGSSRQLTPQVLNDVNEIDHYVTFWPSNYLFLAELELNDVDITDIPATAFASNPDLYYLSLRGNPLKNIESGAFARLERLKILDIRDTTLPLNGKIRQALQEIPSLETIYADSFAFCCITGLTPVEIGAASTGCFAPIDQFSSCDDLLKDETLRIFMWILGVSALLGNLGVIGLRLIRRRQIESSRIQARLITHLAVSDLVMGMYMMIIAVADITYRGDYAINADAWRDSTTCRTAGFMSALSSEVSVFLIMLISLDRLLCVVFSHIRSIQLSNKSSMVCLACVWISAIVICLVPALPVDYFGKFYGRSSVCLGLPLTTDRPPGWEYSISIFLGLNLICFTITALCYVVIYVTVHRSAAKFGKSNRHTSTKGMSMQIKLATKMAVIVGTDFLCWMPIILMAFLSAIGAVEIPADVYAWTAVFVLPLNSSLNPYLYTMSNVMQREKARRKASEKSNSENNTRLSTISSAPPPPRQGSVRTQETNQQLTSQGILTPFNAASLPMSVVPLSKYIEDRGEPPSTVDSALIVQDIRKALSSLKLKSATDMTVAEDRIAVQLNSNGDLVRAFLVSFDPVISKMYLRNQNGNNDDVHKEFISKITQELDGKKAENGA